MDHTESLSAESPRHGEAEKASRWVPRILSIFDRGIFGVFNKSLTAKFLVVMATVLVLLQSISIYVNVCGSQSTLKTSITERIARLSHIAAEASSKNIASAAYNELEPYLSEVLRDEDVVMVKVLDSNENLVVSRKSSSQIVKGPGISSFLSRVLNGTEEYRTPAIVEGVKVGTIIVSWSNTTLNASLLKTAFRTIVTQTIVFLGIGFIMVLFFRIDVKAPVERISGAVEKLTNGDLTVTINLRSKNELGSIARGVTYMAEKLAGTIRNLDKTVHATASAVDGVGLAYEELKKGAVAQSESVKQIARLLEQSKQKQKGITNSVSSLSEIFSNNLSALNQLKCSGEEIASSSMIIEDTIEQAVAATQQVHEAAAVITDNSQASLQYAIDLSSSVSELIVSLQETQSNARTSSELALRVKETTATAGRATVVNMINGMDTISELVQKSTGAVALLGERSKDISQILSVIRGIADEATLLSLNATILAAQAGEHGKGFAVVAAQMKTLAQQTDRKAQEIEGLIKDTRSDIDTTVSSHSLVRDSIRDGLRLAGDVQRVFFDIERASDQSATATTMIERATREQVDGLTHIDQAFQEIREMMNEIVRLTVEQKEAVGHLFEGAEVIREGITLNKKATLDQVRGVNHISDTFTVASEELKRIVEAARVQDTVSEDVLSSIKEIDVISTEAVEKIDGVSALLATLLAEITVLKGEMGVFKI